jgi:hypothetical protein
MSENSERYASLQQVLKDNDIALNRHLRAFADILQRAGMQDPVNSLEIRSPDLGGAIRITWTREGERVHAREFPSEE